MQRFGASPHYALRTGSSPLYPRLFAARVSSRSDEMGAITSGECPNVQVQNPKPIRLPGSLRSSCGGKPRRDALCYGCVKTGEVTVLVV